MRTTLVFAAVAALAFTSAANAKSCHDTNGKWIKCPSAAAAEQSAATMAKASKSAAKMSAHAAKTDLATAKKAEHRANSEAGKAAKAAPVCKTGKPCGASCIPANAVCHKS